MKKHLSSGKKAFANNHAWQAILIVIIVVMLAAPPEICLRKTCSRGRPIPSKVVVKTTYPKVVGYLSFIFPLETFS